MTPLLQNLAASLAYQIDRINEYFQGPPVPPQEERDYLEELRQSLEDELEGVEKKLQEL